MTTYTYDVHGNLRFETKGSDEKEYVYDRKNRQIAYCDGDNYYSYNYRPDGLRVWKSDDSTPTNLHYTWDGMNMVRETFEDPFSG